MRKVNLTPAGWRILIDPDYKDRVDLGDGRFIQIVEPERLGIAGVTKGQVVAMGPDCYRGNRFTNPWCKLGDVVLYAKHGGVIIVEPDTKKKFVILNDEDILGIYEGEANAA